MFLTLVSKSSKSTSRTKQQQSEKEETKIQVGRGVKQTMRVSHSNDRVKNLPVLDGNALYFNLKCIITGFG